jgi:hypothetical protein
MNNNKELNECTVVLVNDLKTPYKINFKEFHIEDREEKSDLYKYLRR